MKKRVLSWLLALVMLVGLLPMGALAARMETGEVLESPVGEEITAKPAEVPQDRGGAPQSTASTSVTVNFTSQAEGTFLHAPQMGVTVASDLAESYGYTDSVTNGVSALDVLVKAHEVKYGNAFTQETAANYLAINSTSGFITTLFGQETSANGFILNGSYPNDGTSSEYGGYNGTTITTQAIEDDDFVEFFIYADSSYYSDQISWFCYNGAPVSELALPGNEPVTLNLNGYMYMGGYLYKDADAMHSANTNAGIESAHVGWVNISTGTITPYEGKSTDTDGQVEIMTPPENGTYYLTAYIAAEDLEDADGPVIMTLLKIKVDNTLPSPASSCKLTSLSVADFESNPNALAMTPAFNSDTTAYSTAAVNYQSAAYMSMCYVTVTAESARAVIKAKLNNGTEKELTSGTLANFGTTNILQPGENNQLVITVTNGGETKTYTVTIPMKDADGKLPGADPDPSPALDVMHAIAAKYAASGIASDPNAPWLAADMAAYAKAFPDTQNKLSEAQKQAYLNVLIPQVDAATKPSDLAKYIIALRAMGYDARNLTTADGKKVDAVKKLTDLVDAKDKAVVNQYTLPYVIVALRQGTGYATAAQIAYLKEQAVATKSAWQNTSWGPDGATPMLLALAPYGNESGVKTALDEAVAAVKATQKADGSVGNAASTALTMVAMAAMGEDCTAVKAAGSDKSLVDGLMTQVSETKDGFKPTTNTFSTEQGLRGLVAWQLMQKAQGKAQVYDFAGLPTSPAAARAANCPVRFNLVPAGAKVTVKQGSTTVKPVATGGLYYDLPAGEYSYTATLSGYNNATGTFTVTADEAANHTAKTVSISLTSKPSESETEDLSITVKVLAHDGDECNNQWTYKHNAEKYTVVIADQTVTVKKGQTAFDAFDAAMKAANKTYTEKTVGYINEIAGYEEFDHGPNSGWQYMIGSTLPTVSCREYALNSNATMTWFYTDDYTREKGSEQWSGSSSSSSASEPKVTVTTGADGKPVAKVELPRNTTGAVATIPTANLGEGNVLVVVHPDGTEEILKKSLVDGKTASALLNGSVTVKLVDNTKSFTDTANHWAGDSIAFVTSHELFQGTSGGTFSPDAPMNRAMLATVLYRLEDAEANGGNPFADVAADTWYTDAVTWASANQIVSGTGSGFAPDRDLSRQELVTMLYRYAKSVGMDTDKTTALDSYADSGNVADWAGEAMAWAVANGLITGRGGAALAPEGTATRAEVATILQRLVALMVK